jgi:hypothetical protein
MAASSASLPRRRRTAAAIESTYVAMNDDVEMGSRSAARVPLA